MTRASLAAAVLCFPTFSLVCVVAASSSADGPPACRLCAPNHREVSLDSCLGRAVRNSQEVHRRRSCAARSLLSRRYEISRCFRRSYGVRERVCGQRLGLRSRFPRHRPRGHRLHRISFSRQRPGWRPPCQWRAAHIDVDDYKFLSQEDLRKDDDYAALLQKYPNVSVFPADRYHTEQPVATSAEDGGQEFQVEYLLQDGCHACARIGTLIVAFDFDSSGRFTEVSALGVRPNPKPDDAQPSVRKHPSTIESKVGDTFTIPLEANHTTGYSWRLAQSTDPAILKQLSEKYEEDNSGSAGAGGVETWTFQAMAIGATTLVFEYARPFEKNVPPAETSKFRITIH